MNTMASHTRSVLLLFTLLLSASICTAADDFSVGIIGPSLKTPRDDSALRQAISETDDENLAFVVVNGIKSAQEACSDNIYLDRKNLLDSAKNGLIISLAGADWTECKTASGKSSAVERLSRLRELFFADDFSFGASKIPLVRQSAAAKFRSYAENSRWELGPVLFATINLPSDNNHYLSAGGRNSEFEDRSVANLNWLQRVVSHAGTHKLDAIVLFCDHYPLAPAPSTKQRDGFAEIRDDIVRVAARFSGRILFVHGGLMPITGTPAGISWQGNLGTLAVPSGWLRLKISPNSPALFSVISNESNESVRVTNKKTAALK
jgi:hypothetical protein